MRRALAASATLLTLVFGLLGSVPGAYAQGSSAAEAITGYLATSGCPGTRAPPCFLQWSPTNPLPAVVTGTASNAADSVATSATNLSTINFPFLWNGATFDRSPGDKTNGAFVNVKVLPALVAGSAIIGNVRIDQTTPGTTNGVQVNAGTAAIGYVGGFNANLSNAPTVQNAAYSASNAIGGLQTVAAFRNTTQPSGIVNYVQVISAGGSTQGMTIYGWTKTPSATCTDKVAYAANAADYPNAIPGFPVVLTPAVTQGTTASRASQSIVVSIKNTDSSPTVNLYFCAVVNGSVTPASTTDLTFGYSIAQD